MSELDTIGVFTALRAACRLHGGEAAWAERHGMTKQYVNKVLHAGTSPGPAILAALGLRKVTRYAPTNGGQLDG